MRAGIAEVVEVGECILRGQLVINLAEEDNVTEFGSTPVVRRDTM